MKLSILIVLCLSASTAVAQPSLTEPAPVGATAPAGPSDDGDKDPTTAVVLSLVGSAIPVALIAVGSAVDDKNVQGVAGVGAAIGMLVGPSLGHWYAGDYVTGGMAMRGVGGTAFVVGAMKAFGDCFLKEDTCSSDGGAIMLMGGAVFTAGVIYDIATSAEAARQYNAKHARRSLQMGPTMVGAHSTPGVGIAGTF